MVTRWVLVGVWVLEIGLFTWLTILQFPALGWTVYHIVFILLCCGMFTWTLLTALREPRRRRERARLEDEWRQTMQRIEERHDDSHGA